MSEIDQEHTEESQGFFERARNHSFFWFALPISVVLGIPSFIDSFTQNTFGIGFSIAIIVPLALILSGLARYRLNDISLLSQNQAKLFFPFLPADGSKIESQYVLDRKQRLIDFIECCDTTSTLEIVSGESGIGKSTILRDLTEHNGLYFITENSPADFANKLLEISDTQGKHIAFDQFERVIDILDISDTQTIQNILNAIKNLKSKENKIYISVRSDFLSKAINIFRDIHYHINIINGIDFRNRHQTLNEIRAKFDVMGIRSQQVEQLLQKLMTAKETNTFYLQLAGYILESTPSKERRKILEDLDFNDEIIRTYVDFLLQEYANIIGDHTKKIELEIVLFTLAVANSQNSMPLSTDEIGRIAHMPTLKVERCVKYLLQRYTLTPTGGGISRYFLAHDTLAREIIKMTPRYMRQDHRTAINELIEGEIEEILIEEVHPEINPFRRLFTNIPSGPFFLSLGLVSIWFAAISYGYRLQNEWVSGYIINNIQPFLDYNLNFITSIETTYAFYPITFTLYIWILFMYGLDRGYFYYLRKYRVISLFSYSLVYSAGSLGIIIGLVASFFPPIFPMGVIIPGTLLAFAYFSSASRCPNPKTTHYKYSSALCWQIILNMSISTAVTFLVAQGYLSNLENNDHVWNIGMIFVVSFLFALFAYAMKERQGSEAGRWALLAICSASYVNHRSKNNNEFL